MNWQIKWIGVFQIGHIFQEMSCLHESMGGGALLRGHFGPTRIQTQISMSYPLDELHFLPALVISELAFSEAPFANSLCSRSLSILSGPSVLFCLLSLVGFTTVNWIIMTCW